MSFKKPLKVVSTSYDAKGFATGTNADLAELASDEQIHPENLGSGTRDGSKFLRDDGTWQPGGSGAAWGSISGTLSSQSDLNTALSAKEATANKDASGGYPGLTLFKINFKNAANSFTSFLQNLNTAARTYTFQDRNGTIADDTDITAAKARGNHTGTQLAATISDFNTAALAAAPAETATTTGAIINGAAAKTTPVDADHIGLMDSAASNILRKLSWANIKAALKTYFDSSYAPQGFSTVIDGGGSAITTGAKGFLIAPFACTITGWTIVGDQSGSIVVDVKKSTYSGFPTQSSIAASAKPSLSSAQKNTNSTLTGWTTSVAAGDVIGYNVDSAATVTRVTVILNVTRT